MDSSAELSKNQFVDKPSREMAYRVLGKCFAEVNSGVMNKDRPWVRASIYTGLSIDYLKKIHKKEEEKKEKLTTRSKFVIDDFDRHTIYQCIFEYLFLYPRNRWKLSILLRFIRKRFTFPWNTMTLWKMMKVMGFKRRFDSVSVSYIPYESQESFSARKEYLEKIEMYRRFGRSIVYIDETWVDQIRFKKYWRTKAENAIITDVDAKNRLILMHAGSKSGFLDKVKWLFEVGIQQGSLRVQMSKQNFELWVTKLLIPNLPPCCVVVMDRASYHNDEIPVPTKSSTKEEMLAWANGALKDVFDWKQDMEKEHIFSLIELHLPQEVKPVYKIDSILKSHGHDVLRIPPYMNAEFNPILLAWEKMADILDIKMADAGNDCINITDTRILQKITEKAISKITAKDWEEFDSKIKIMEEMYRITDKKMEHLYSTLGI